MNKIAFVIPYFGEFPPWMDYFLASCRRNDSIDFILLSDNSKPEASPSNIFYHSLEFDEYKEIVSSRLGIKFDPESAYKLCDIKPALGFIHKELLESYDFWGFCDIDVVFGDIRNFLTDDLLSQVDFFSAHARRVAGHFSLMKNEKKYNESFFRVKDWKCVFEDQAHYGFDEKHFSDLYLGFKNYPSVLSRPLMWAFLPLSRKALFREEFSTPELRYSWIDGTRNFPSEWYWNRGRLTNNRSDREFLYLHFLKWKKDWSGSRISHVPKDSVNDRWKVTVGGFEQLSHWLVALSVIC
jgi:hypothetical protein